MYRLLGKDVSHSYSAEIYQYLGYDYGILDLREDKFENFMRNRVFQGLNITMPYKERVIKHLDHLDDVAEEIGVVNTVVKKEGQLWGYNTDYYGLDYLIKKHNINLLNKNILILGTGATSKSAASVFRHHKANKIVKVSRSRGKDSITYDDLQSVLDFDIIINTTPAGMYPNVEEKLIDLSKFNNLQAVIDVIYNPLKTNLIIQAEKLNIKAVGGLEMLVGQAIKSANLFFDEKFKEEKVKEVYQKALSDKLNIVLIGMPTSGKTTIGQKLAKKLNKDFKDVDQIIVEQSKRTIKEMFKQDGEDYFRIKETALIKELSLLNNTVIATGGGSILDKNNIKRLKRNGLIFFIDRAKEKLYAEESRPLTASDEDLDAIFEKRYSLYKKASDFQVKNDKDIDAVVKEIMEKIKWKY